MPAKATPERCTKCGAEITTGAADDLCTACLLETGLESNQPTDGEFSRPPPLARFGDYELLAEIARGGMGVVYRARQVSLNRIVAVKMILSGALASESERQRFRAEAETAARLQHPNIVAIHEVSEHEGHPFFSMDLVEGQSLAQRARNEPMPVRRAAQYLKTIAEAVQYAHSRGVLHRDLKPSNILIDHADQPRVTDFGLAKQIDKDSDLTLTGQVLGSPNFMPPEQATGQHRKIGPASDVYSLGAVLYQLLTGRAPFIADTITQTLRLVAESEPVAPRLLNGSVPRDLEVICLKCLEKDPWRRYTTAQELADELQRFLLGEPIRARPISHAGKVWRWCRRNPALASSGAAAAVLLLTVVVGSPIAVWRIERERVRAETNAVHAARMAKLESEHRGRAEERELVTRQNLYAVDMKLAQGALNIDDRQRAMMLLDRNRPRPGEIDLRNWEWRHLWQLCRSDEVVTLGHHSNVVFCVAISPNGRLLVSGGYDRTIHVWDLVGRRHQVALKPQSETYCVAFSPSGEFFATGGQKVVKVWNAKTLQEVATLPTDRNVRGVAFSPDGKRVASVGSIGIDVWNIADRTKEPDLLTEKFRDASIERLAYSPDGTLIAVGEVTGRIRLFDSKSGAERISWNGHSNFVTALIFLPDGKSLFSASRDQRAVLWDVGSGEEKVVFIGHSRTISSLAVSPDGRTLVTASSDQTLRFWEIQTGKEFGKLHGHYGRVNAVAFSPDGRTIASGGADDAVKLWNTFPPPKPHRGIADDVRHLTFSPDGRTFAIITAGWKVLLGDAVTLEPVEGLVDQQVEIRSVAFSPDGYIATGDETGSVRLWNGAIPREPRFLAKHSAAIYGLHFSLDGRSLCSWDSNSVLKRWDVATGQETASCRVQHRSRAMAISPDHKRVALGSGASVRLLDLATGQSLATFRGHRQTILDLAYSPDGGLIASASADETIRVWDTRINRDPIVLRGHRSDVDSIEFSPDGRRLASGAGGGGVVRIWDTTTWQEVTTFELGRRSAERVFYSPDGNIFVAGTTDDTSQDVTIWHVLRAPTIQEIDATEHRIPPGRR